MEGENSLQKEVVFLTCAHAPWNQGDLPLIFPKWGYDISWGCEIKYRPYSRGFSVALPLVLQTTYLASSFHTLLIMNGCSSFLCTLFPAPYPCICLHFVLRSHQAPCPGTSIPPWAPHASPTSPISALGLPARGARQGLDLNPQGPWRHLSSVVLSWHKVPLCGELAPV